MTRRVTGSPSHLPLSTRDQAKARIQAKDRERTRYLQSAFRADPSAAEHYDLTINTDALDLNSAVDLIELALDRKAECLSSPATAVGPAAGMSAYPGTPRT